MNHEDYALIRKIIDGDTRSFRLLIQKYRRLVFHIIFRFASNKTDREELGQEIFLKVYENLTTFKYESNTATWISKIAHNSCINYLKKKKNQLFDDIFATNPNFDRTSEDIAPTIDNFPSNLLTTEEVITSDEIRQILNKEINLLPVLFKEIISLYYLENFSYKEISEIVNLPGGTIKSYMFRVRLILKERLLSKFKEEEL